MAGKPGKSPKSEMVEHPLHYNQHPSGVECIEIIRHMTFNLGAAVKHVWRAGKKGDIVEDLKKSIFYIQDEIDKIERRKADIEKQKIERSFNKGVTDMRAGIDGLVSTPYCLNCKKSSYNDEAAALVCKSKKMIKELDLKRSDFPEKPKTWAVRPGHVCPFHKPQ